MKKYPAARKHVSAVLMAGVLGIFTFASSYVVEAQEAPTKIQLLAETLRARDSGNLVLAKQKAEELIKIAPNDTNVQSLLASINQDLDRQGGSRQVFFGQASNAPVETAMRRTSNPVVTTPVAKKPVIITPVRENSVADSMIANVAADQDTKIVVARNAIYGANELTRLGAYEDASRLLDDASAGLTLNLSTAEVLQEIERAKTRIILTQASALAASGDPKAGEAILEEYHATGKSSKDSRLLAKAIDAQISDPYALSIAEISPEYVTQSKVIRDLLTRGRAQYLNGDYDGAANTFKAVEARDANNAEAKLFQTRIAEILGNVHAQNQYKTREQMLTEVDQGWERPKVFDVDKNTYEPTLDSSGILQKMKSIVIPQVNFSGIELTRVINTLSELSVEYDPENVGVNIVPLFDANQNNPRVNISLRNLNLDRILEFVTQQVNFAYSVGLDAVTVDMSDAIDGESSNVTEFFPISRATIIRLTGFRDSGGFSTDSMDPFAPISAASSAPSQNDETDALKSFFQSAGVNFDAPGASLAFDGEQLIVTQTSRNLERMRVILRNYNEVKQVEIETKFLEVSQNDLEEVGFDWYVTNDTGSRAFAFGRPSSQFASALPQRTDNPSTQIGANGRSIGDAFSGANSGNNQITVTSQEDIPVGPPVLSGILDFASLAGSAFAATGWGVNGYDVDFAIRALSRKTGSDLMSAPKVTVLSGKRATITVAQELRYPESYGDIESSVSSGNAVTSSGSIGGSAISITAGTPQDFVTRNVGVEMSVTPNVENDDSISLILEPRVTEFEGFVEYGGPSVALDGNGTTVTVPSGFYQPIFSTREITTEVTVFDGATVVMGGLTRDEVKTVHDKVPVLGDIPGIGRLFRSEGETRQKRNLLIFVTANLVSPGGSPARQNYRNVNANSLFQNPTIMTPSGAVNRSIDNGAE